jgi:DNA-binding transcriptional MerR regulator
MDPTSSSQILHNEAVDSEEGLFPIRTVASLTGVHPVTLRAWERRYGLIQPRRTAKGHRLYSRSEIEHIRRVTALLEDGVPISQAGRLLAVSPGEGALTPPLTDAWSRYGQKVENALAHFDIESLEAIYNEALSLYPVDVVTSRLVLPTLETLGQRWAEGSRTIAEEHFFTAYLRNKLGAQLHHQGLGLPGPSLVAACLPGEHHEIGLLLFCLSASARGYRPILLGANMPLEEIPQAAEQARAQAVILSSSVQSLDGELERRLRGVAESSSAPVFLGGHTAIRQRADVERSGVIGLGIDIPRALRELDTYLRRHPQDKGSPVPLRQRRSRR